MTKSDKKHFYQNLCETTAFAVNKQIFKRESFSGQHADVENIVTHWDNFFQDLTPPAQKESANQLLILAKHNAYACDRFEPILNELTEQNILKKTDISFYKELHALEL
jgi:hypothetical protein